MNIEKSEISCTSRTYLIKCGDVEIEIESHKLLEGEDIECILESDDLLNMPLKEILKNGIIKKIEIPKKEKRKGKIVEFPEENKKLIKGNKIKGRRRKIQYKKPEQAEFNPKERIAVMSQMGEIFSRIRYTKYIEDKCKIKMSKYMAHGDLEMAVRDGVIQETDQKVPNPETGHKLLTYRVIQKLEISPELEDRLKSKEKVVKPSIFRKGSEKVI